MITIDKADLQKEKEVIDQLNPGYHSAQMNGANTNAALSWLSLSITDKKMLIKKINALQEYTHQPPRGSFTNIINKIRESKGRIEILH